MEGRVHENMLKGFYAGHDVKDGLTRKSRIHFNTLDHGVARLLINTCIEDKYPLIVTKPVILFTSTYHCRSLQLPQGERVVLKRQLLVQNILCSLPGSSYEYEHSITMLKFIK